MPDGTSLPLISSAIKVITIKSMASKKTQAVYVNKGDNKDYRYLIDTRHLYKPYDSEQREIKCYTVNKVSNQTHLFAKNNRDVR